APAGSGSARRPTAGRASARRSRTPWRPPPRAGRRAVVFVVANYHSEFRLVNPFSEWYGHPVPAQRQPRDQARRARTHVDPQHVFAAAERIFADHGFENAKLQEISRLAGLSMGTIYAIFPSKADLHRAILEDRGLELLGLARDIAVRKGPARAALDALIEVY